MSEILNGSINLEKLVHAKVKTKKGNNAILIPVDENFLYSGEKGTYLNVTVFVNEEPDDYGAIASIKQNGQVKDKKWSELSEDEQAKIKGLPYLGNLSKQAGASKTEEKFEDADVIDDDNEDLPF